MHTFKTTHARYLLKHQAPRKRRINPYPLLDILLVFLTAALAYASLYCLLSA
jgi:hypothetical protein